MDLVDPAEPTGSVGGEPPPPWETADVDEPPSETSLMLRTRKSTAIFFLASFLAPVIVFFVAGPTNAAGLRVLAGLMVLVIPVQLLEMVRDRGLPGQPFALIDSTEVRWMLPLGRRPVSIDGLADLRIVKPAFPVGILQLRRASDGRRLLNLAAVRRSDVRALHILIIAASYHRDNR